MTKSSKHLHPSLRKYDTSLMWIPKLLRYKWGIRLIHRMKGAVLKEVLPGYTNEEWYIPSNHGGPDIRIKVFKDPTIEKPVPAVIYFHGGGYIMGHPEGSLDVIRQLLNKRPCVVIAPDYRKALDAPFPAAFNDAYDTLIWARDNANEMQILDHSFIIAGHSAGGGLTAAVSLKARDTKSIDIAFQMPIYPMIDDRHITTSSQWTDTLVWDGTINRIAWDHYLKNYLSKSSEIPTYAAPARSVDNTDLPPTISLVGSLDPFKDEVIAYMGSLHHSNVPTLFKLFEGGYHAFELKAPNADLSKSAIDFTYDSFATYYDQFITGLA